jgi:hypothetical protein
MFLRVTDVILKFVLQDKVALLMSF